MHLFTELVIFREKGACFCITVGITYLSLLFKMAAFYIFVLCIWPWQKALNTALFYVFSVMLSRRMREFLEHPENFSRLEKRVYKHLLQKRLAETLKDLEIINEKIINGALPRKITNKGKTPRTREVAGSNPARSTKYFS